MTELSRFYSFAPCKALVHPRKKQLMAVPTSQNNFIGNDPLEPNRLSLNNGIQQGDFFVGPLIPSVNATPVRNTFEYLAKRDSSDEFLALKILTVNHEGETNEDRQGKVLLHNEHLILSLLQNQRGVIHHHGLFKDRNRYILALDCLVAHEYDPARKYSDYVNLQHYVIKKKRLKEREALELFGNVLVTVQTLHKKNIVHRDLKLGNMILNTRTREITLMNFALSKHLVRSSDMLTDQRGSLAYVSPDVLSGNPYDGKASDMWAMGVLLYTMLYGQFPFYDNDPQELFRKIRAAEYTIPNDGQIKKHETAFLIRQLIEKDTMRRLTADQACDIIQKSLSRISTSTISEHAQVVPDSVSRTQMDDCMVPDAQMDNMSPTASLNGASHASNVDMNAVRLTLSPMLLSESHGNHVGVATFHMPISLSPNSPNTAPFVPYILTDFPPPHVQRPRPSTSSRNPFAQVCSSPPAPHFFPSHTSPTHSLNMSSNLPGSRSSPHNTPTHLTSPSHSFPPPAHAPPPPQSSLVCHHYPLSLSLSTDSYFSSSAASSPNNAHQHRSNSSPNAQSRSMLSFHQSASTNESALHADRLASTNVMDSLVTIRTSRSSVPQGATVTFSSSSRSNRHSYAGLERAGHHLTIPASTHSQTQRRRRNSSGCEQRVRRHSTHTVSPSTTGTTTVGSTQVIRRRRRSHDARDEQNELLESLQAAATRRTSRGYPLTPFQNSLQIQYSREQQPSTSEGSSGN